MTQNHPILKVLNSLEAARPKEGINYWNISHDTGVFLNTLLLATHAKQVLEIGTSNGYSSLWIAEALINTHGQLITIESHAGRFAEAEKNFATAGVTNIVRQIKGHAPEILSRIEGVFDVIFLDATKEEHTSYVTALEEKLGRFGLIITDNIISHRRELTPYIEYMNSRTDFQNSIVPISAGLMVSVKK